MDTELFIDAELIKKYEKVIAEIIKAKEKENSILQDHKYAYEQIKKLEKDYLSMKKIGKIPKGVFKRVFVCCNLGISEGSVTNVKNEFEKDKKISKNDEDFKKEKNQICKDKIIPLLKNLGYCEDEYIYDKTIKMGNKADSNCRPDFQLLSNIKSAGKYYNSAPVIIEAKIVGEYDDNIEKAFAQAVTYARRLSSPYIMIATQNELLLYFSKNNYINSKGKVEGCKFNSSWTELSTDQSIFEKLEKEIGRKHFKWQRKDGYYTKKS